ncbi:MAG TPA: hypothetical protein PLP06_06050 [Saprospiraceae bacterium]|nr:hypothetical protein [Saprospiraceae bacterium]
MSQFKHILTSALFLIVFYSCTDHNTGVKIDKIKLKEIVTKQNNLLERYFKSGDAEQLALIYTDSAKLSPNGTDFILGRDSIKAFWMKDFKSSRLLEMSTDVLTTSGNEDIIYETGKTKTQSLYKDSVYNFTVKYINVWIKQPDGEYKLDVDFWNEDK